MPQPEAIDPTADKTPKYDFAVLDNAEPPRSIVYEIESDRPVLILGIEPFDQLSVEQIAGILNQNDVGSVMLFATNQDRRSALDDLINDAIEQWHEGDSSEEMHTFLGWSFEEYMAWANNRTLPKALARLVAPAESNPADENAAFLKRAAQSGLPPFPSAPSKNSPPTG
ncbi:hypothetical protein [Erythrobacter aureus]|uniref:Uncharacterized protein n=1 Tax=Erythrobacter aureus TaxID=2182384 RepID=A0A345YJ58_9SPHN|nr:hypothetical protein [Erythrobacter aureus]AXK43960.1 hypothetical protein DVR09_16020 [Erythrobacter aureus]